MRALLLTSLLLIGISSGLRAQYRSEPVAVGIEQDVLPWILKGHIVTGWMGKGGIRTRVSFAQASQPAFTRGNDIAEDRVHAFGLSCEYFFRRMGRAHLGSYYNGLWMGPGIGYWRNEIRTLSGVKARNESFIFSFGGGYNFFLTSWLYTSPWLALHTRISGTDVLSLGSESYAPMQFTPEVSIKLGAMLFPSQILKRGSTPHIF